MPEEKILYSFTVTQKVEKSRKETTQDAEGNEVTKTIKETVDVPVKVTIKQPTRRQDDEAEEYYAVAFSNYIKNGLITKAMLANKYSDNGGLMSEADTKEYSRLLKELLEAKDDYTKKAAFAKENKKKTKELDELGQRIVELTQGILRTENRYQNLFELTAENKAEAQRLLWYALHLSFVEGEDKDVLLYPGDDFEAKKESYYVKEGGDDELYSQIRQKLWIVYAVWQFNRNASPTELAELIESISKGE
jgi:hypothetical protein